MNKKIYIDRLFPDVNTLQLHHKLKINQESIMYITIPTDAEQITRIIKNHLAEISREGTDIVVCDATAGVGGNTISFAQHFGKVHAVEVDTERFNYLTNNVNAYRFENVTLHHGDCHVVVPQIGPQDVIFVDPPWGGKGYKKREKVVLRMGDSDVEDTCLRFLTSAKILVVKLPKNYDVEHFYRRVSPETKRIYLYELNKMVIIVGIVGGVGDGVGDGAGDGAGDITPQG